MVSLRRPRRESAEPAFRSHRHPAAVDMEGGLLLTQVRRDPQQLRIALNAARNNLRLAAA